MVLSTTAEGTINHIARGFSSFVIKSSSEELPSALSCTNSFTAFADMSNTTHWWPPLMSRRTILAPILPRPIIPSCINLSFADFDARLPLLITKSFNLIGKTPSFPVELIGRGEGVVYNFLRHSREECHSTTESPADIRYVHSPMHSSLRYLMSI